MDLMSNPKMLTYFYEQEDLYFSRVYCDQIKKKGNTSRDYNFNSHCLPTRWEKSIPNAA